MFWICLSPPEALDVVVHPPGEEYGRDFFVAEVEKWLC
jgi:hypothetical protein